MRLPGPPIEDSAARDPLSRRGSRYRHGPMVVRRLVVLAVLAATLGACSGDDGNTLPSVTGGPGAAPGTGTLVSGSASAGSSAPTGSTSTSTTAATTTSTTTTTTPPAPPAPPTTVFPAVEAAAWTVYDPRSGQFLASHEPDAQLPVGSLIKLLTAQTAYAAGNPVKVAKAPAGLLIDPEESRIGIFEGQELSRDILVRAMLIVSANDAARMLAIDIAGGEAQFAELMNQQAAALGLTNTHAVNVTGLDADGQFSSASDMTRLAALLMGNQSFQLAVARTEAQLNGQSFPATNDLLEKYPGADGVKTGRTTNAGWCSVASATRENRRMIVTVLGAPTEEARDASAMALLDWAFAQPVG